LVQVVDITFETCDDLVVEHDIQEQWEEHPRNQWPKNERQPLASDHHLDHGYEVLNKLEVDRIDEL
jgi:ribonuclease HI